MITANTPSSFKPKNILRASVAVVIGLTLFASAATASDAGQTAIQTQLNTMANQGIVKPGTTIRTAKAADLNLAVCLAIEEQLQNPNPLIGVTINGTAEITASALQPVGGKVRGDRNTVASQLVATAISTDAAMSDEDFADVVGKVYSVNSAIPGGNLTSGKIAVIAQGIQSATASQAFAMGDDDDITSSNYSVLLVGVINKMKGATYASGDQLQAFVSGLYDENKISPINDETFALDVARKTASINGAGAGAVLGAYVEDRISGDTDLETFATTTVGDPKLQKALGEILARTMVTHTDKSDLADALSASILLNGQPKPNYALVTQGILRAGDASDVAGILDGLLPAVQPDIVKLSKFAGVISIRTGGDQAKLVNIVDEVVSGQSAINKSTLGASIISTSGVDNPESAAAAIGAVIDSDAGVSFNSSLLRTALAQGVAAKVKAYSAVGYMVGEVIDRNIADDGYIATNTAGQVTSIMLKNSKAATDIAYRVAALSGVGIDKAAFAVALSNSNKKFVINAATGASLADPQDAGDITAAAVTHDPTFDKGALGKAAVIAGVVATAVDAEAAADIGAKLAAKMAKTTTALRPIKISLATTLAKNLAKAIQTKPGVNTANRMDELGEVGAAITGQILGQFPDTVSLSKAIIGVGKALILSLNKKELVDSKTQKADLTEARDIVGSIFQTIFTSSLSAATKAALLGTVAAPGSIELAFLKATAKPGTTHYVQVQQAVDDVLNGMGGTKFEVGSDYDPITDNVNG